jgi:Zn-dependent protease
MNRGWWTLGRLRGAPIRLHWTLPLGALLWSSFRFVPGFWLAFAILILVHELGHALLVLRYRLGLVEIAVHGAGGYCQHGRSGSRFEEAAISWGGVLAQLALFAVVQLVVLVLGPPQSAFWGQVHSVFTHTNLWLAALNLIPIEPLDGAKAWPLLGMWLSRLKRRTVADELRDISRVPTQSETPNERTDRIVRDLIARTTQSKDR